MLVFVTGILCVGTLGLMYIPTSSITTVKACLIKDGKEKRKFLQLSISPLTAQERSIAENYVIKLVQKDYFGKLYDYVQSLNGNICCKVKRDLKIAFRPLITLSVFCDHTGVLRSHS